MTEQTNPAEHPSRVRSVSVWLLACAVLGGAVWVLLPVPTSTSGGFAEILVGFASWVLLACLTWLWLCTTAIVLIAWRSTVSAAQLRGVPAPVRRAVLLACGAALTTVSISPVNATPGPAADDGTDRSGRTVLSELPYPDRATDQGPTSPRQRPSADGGSTGPHAGTRAPARVTVRPGDTLWGLAAERLSTDADRPRIAEGWRELYQTNRAVVGEDPDHIVPGQVLHLPPSLR